MNSGRNSHRNLPRLLASVLGLTLLCAQAPAKQLSAGTLLMRHAELREQLADNPFQRPLIVESSDHDDQLKGEIYAQFEQPLEDAHPFDFLYQVKSDQSDFLHVQLTATEGPLVTSDYNIELQLVALDEQRSFLHLSYAYNYGLVSKASMEGYLATIGRDKVGFSVTGNGRDGQPIYQDGMRGVVERNTMRYYLALEAYLGALSGTSAVRQEQRLNDWHSAVERFPLQLHELERSEYLAMKHMEIRRQQGLLTEKPLL